MRGLKSFVHFFLFLLCRGICLFIIFCCVDWSLWILAWLFTAALWFVPYNLSVTFVSFYVFNSTIYVCVCVAWFPKLTLVPNNVVGGSVTHMEVKGMVRGQRGFQVFSLLKIFISNIISTSLECGIFKCLENIKFKLSDILLFLLHNMIDLGL